MLFDKAPIHQGGDATSLPHRVKWFKEKGLDVIDIAGGKGAVIVKTRAANGTEAYYGLPYKAERDEEEEDDECADHLNE